ncbi:MAG: phosphoenolpyruvate--protein phosphotransferase [Ignavibacteria bacterium CG22_combo_CG10-13_8_21_14_all_37_15]|nr:phosphoenolpyruvate--protein phosphotransferase [Ignavibacteria bacterium]OIO15112.1 MAG: phosphoenolpyruvate--protein phosphotransferase [Ignavibacteria bacterium CG1_02_37_35]PIP76580.1 MAG: phosphoenolpyruvate--protein phosphotransferase [Ignavibacteria bacterium CG22_combo_CG10-13_8_21_14_all_37_15]PIX95137.1 MAG: phosphoenolpyruvate--protein phosphotransferase [Ignavibacteria bacterium CG_4_10_14_3_um_filter_37_18]PJC57360.1 MAG: phosphoenolpyruvate--protein phosphotransferase [Ignaviba
MKGLKEILKHSGNYLTGIAAAPGLTIGKAYVFAKEVLEINHNEITEVDEAITLFNEALEKSQKELRKIFGFAKEKMGETRAAIFEAHLMILDDPVLIGNITARIKQEKRFPEFIVDDEISKYQQLMFSASEHYMKERALDIEDIKNRIIRNLQKKRWQSKIPHGVIVVSGNITPADTILFTKSSALGYITDHGGLTSHAAIIARSLNLPAVVGTHNSTEKIKDGDLLVIDGFHGIIFINPDENQIEYFTEKIKHLSEINQELQGLTDKPAETLDGRKINLLANVDVSSEIDLVITNGAKGIGLFRTEQIIEEIGEFPDEEEQVKIYSKLADRIYPENITIRAFDIGGDKVRQFDLQEANPFLGLRGVRLLLENENLFKIQIRAVLRASIHKNINFMIPMVSTLQEIKRTKLLFDECKAELHKAKIPFDKHLKIGIMIEVPSAAVMAGDYAAEVDFLSIGTNDLIQYLMAVDRGNDYVSDLYQEFHPSVIRTLAHIVHEGKKSNALISICGEMAADTLAVPLLVGLGLKSLSVSPSAIPSVKRTIRALDYSKAQKLAEECLILSSEDEIIKTIEKFFKDNLIQRTRNIL